MFYKQKYTQFKHRQIDKMSATLDPNVLQLGQYIQFKCGFVLCNVFYSFVCITSAFFSSSSPSSFISIPCSHFPIGSFSLGYVGCKQLMYEKCPIYVNISVRVCIFSSILFGSFSSSFSFNSLFFGFTKLICMWLHMYV